MVATHFFFLRSAGNDNSVCSDSCCRQHESARQFGKQSKTHCAATHGSSRSLSVLNAVRCRQVLLAGLLKKRCKNLLMTVSHHISQERHSWSAASQDWKRLDSTG